MDQIVRESGKEYPSRIMGIRSFLCLPLIEKTAFPKDQYFAPVIQRNYGRIPIDAVAMIEHSSLVPDADGQDRPFRFFSHEAPLFYTAALIPLFADLFSKKWPKPGIGHFQNGSKR